MHSIKCYGNFLKGLQYFETGEDLLRNVDFNLNSLEISKIGVKY